MRALAAAGRRQDALAEFEQLRGALREHSEGDPDPETRALYRELLGADGARAARAGAARAAPRRAPGPGDELRRPRPRAGGAATTCWTASASSPSPAPAAPARRASRWRPRARPRRDALPGGAWLADLGALRDPALVPQQVATALRVPIPANRPALDALIAHLGRAPATLIVLDTCEHVLHAAAELADALLAAAPAVRFLATSRGAAARARRGRVARAVAGRGAGAVPPARRRRGGRPDRRRRRADRPRLPPPGPDAAGRRAGRRALRRR